eukprot:TRINITY_DN8427_c0_g1_i3.p3 TRINITY_DN8427_c0_g1~~TRINITY_DN8427_c0_g1_i3.p3  ORF type:complete len:112 (-),score=2.28 TRINITY_DN8427_c0_g1_i3:563-898(-)
MTALAARQRGRNHHQCHRVHGEDEGVPCGDGLVERKKPLGLRLLADVLLLTIKPPTMVELMNEQKAVKAEDVSRSPFEIRVHRKRVQESDRTNMYVPRLGPNTSRCHCLEE